MANANINTQRNGVGGSALVYAVIRDDPNDVDTVQFLIHSGADLEITGVERQTPLFMAAARGKWKYVTLLVEANASVHFRDEVYSGMTTLLVASQNGQSAIVELLLQKGANASDTEPTCGYTALMLACQKADLPTVKVLLKHSAEVNVMSSDEEKITALLIAARSGCHGLVQLLLESGAEVNVRTSDNGFTPLMLASQIGSFDTVESLLDHGAEVNAQRPGSSDITALMFAVSGHHPKVADLLLARGADPALKTSIGRSIAHSLARDGDLKTLDPFLSRSVDWTEAQDAEFIFDNVDSKGVAPLHLAARYGNRDFITTLFDGQYITDLQPVCGNAFTPLHWAAGNGQASTAQALLSRGADVDALTTTTHKTALHYAAAMGDLKTVAVLLNAKASIYLRDADQNTAEMLTHNPSILRVLQKEHVRGSK